MMRFGHHVVIGIFCGMFTILIVSLTGCSDDGVSTCTPGQVVECPCPDGEQGVQSCEDDGTFGGCECGAEPNHGDADAGFSGDADAGFSGDADAGFSGDANDVDTGAGEENDCGGEEMLTFDDHPAKPGDSCGPCDDGELVCTAPDELFCADASSPNSCGGCSSLDAEPGEECWGQGVWECDGEEDVKCGGGEPPEIYVSTTQVVLEAQPTGVAEDYLRVRNIGAGLLSLEEISITDGEDDYTISFFDELDADGELPPYDDDVAEAPDELEPDDDLYIRVRFSSDDIEPSYGNLRIESDDPFQGIVDIDLLGNAGVPCLEVVGSSDGTVDFGAGSTNTVNYRAITLRNCSLQSELELQEISISDGDDGAFSIDDDDLPGDLPADSKTLAPEEVTTVLVAFTPQEGDEDYEGELFVESTDGANPELHILLMGTGVASGCPVAEVAGVVDSGPADNPVTATNQDIVNLTAEGSYDPDGGSLTYEWSVIDRPDGSLAEVIPSDVEQPEFVVDIVGDYVIELKVFDESGISNCEPALVEVMAVPMKDVHIQLVWESPSVEAAGGVDEDEQRGTNLDLHYVRPGGNWGDPGNSVYWQQPEQDWNGDGSNNVSLDIDGLWGTSPENINHIDPEIGGHEVGVHFYRDYCWGPAEATVRIYFGEALVQEEEGQLEETDNFWYVGTVDWQGDPQSSSFNAYNQFTETHSLTSHWDIYGEGVC